MIYKLSHTGPSKLGVSLIAAFSLLPPLVGCASESAVEESGSESEGTEAVSLGLSLDDESEVVASFDSVDGRQVKFVEDEPGFLTILQAGRIGTEPLISQEMFEVLGPEEIYKELTGRTAPAALRAASLRRRELVGDQLSEPLDVQVPRTVPQDIEAEVSRTVPQDMGLSGAETVLGSSIQALFSDAWLWDQGICWSGHTNLMRFRNNTQTRDMINHEVRGAESVVYNTGTVANVTGSAKIRPRFTWSSGTGYNLAPNFYVSFRFDHFNGIGEFDAKTYIDPHGSVYTACQHGWKP